MSTTDISGAPILPTRRRKVRWPDLASQWQRMWWKFRRHKMAVFGLGILGLLVACALFAEFISPYPPGQRDTKYVLGPPQMPQLVDTHGQWHLPFVYGIKSVRDP